MRSTRTMESSDHKESLIPERVDLTAQQSEFLAIYTTNPFVAPKTVCQQIGVTTKTYRKWMRENAKFRAALRAEENRMQNAADMSRRKVMHGLLEAVEIAKDLRQPGGMISGWKEIGRMCGYYEPERREVRISVEHKQLIQDLKTMPKEQLLQLMHEEKQSNSQLLEADYEVVER